MADPTPAHFPWESVSSCKTRELDLSCLVPPGLRFCELGGAQCNGESELEQCSRMGCICTRWKLIDYVSEGSGVDCLALSPSFTWYTLCDLRHVT